MRRISVAMRRMSLALDLCDADEALPLLAFLTLELRQVRQARLGWRERKTFQSGLDRIGRHGLVDPLVQLLLHLQWRGGWNGDAPEAAGHREVRNDLGDQWHVRVSFEPRMAVHGQRLELAGGNERLAGRRVGEHDMDLPRDQFR